MVEHILRLFSHQIIMLVIMHSRSTAALVLLSVCCQRAMRPCNACIWSEILQPDAALDSNYPHQHDKEKLTTESHNLAMIAYSEDLPG